MSTKTNVHFENNTLRCHQTRTIRTIAKCSMTEVSFYKNIHNNRTINHLMHKD